jgi:solute carrier family 8 (sodium/calcium exchanger)
LDFRPPPTSESKYTFEENVIAGVILGHIKHAVVTILSDDGTIRYFRQMDRLVPRLLDSLTPGTETWKDQLIAATSVNAGDIQNATFGFTHILCFPWKVIFALVPPPIFLNGWLAFLVGLVFLGVITAIVGNATSTPAKLTILCLGDLASIFGCMVGLKDSITAITFVAMGTSLPDTFASRFAALQDKSADNAIGNVTG